MKQGGSSPAGRLLPTLLLVTVLGGALTPKADAVAGDPAARAPDEITDSARIEDRALADWSDGRYAAAVDAWRQLIAQDPGRRHYRLGLVRTLVSAGSIDEARSELDRARQVPAANRSDRYNTLVAEAEVLRAERRDEAARTAFAAAEEVARGGASRTGTRAIDDAPTLPWRFRTGILIDHFDNQRQQESQRVYELGYRYSPNLITYALYERHSRFDRRDDVYLVGAALRPLDALALRVDVGVSPDAEFRPRHEAAIGLDWIAIDWLHPLLSYQRLDYDDGEVSTLSPGLRFPGTALGDIELRYASTRDIDGAHSRYGAIRFDWLIGDRWLPSLSLQQGDEALPPEVRSDFQRVAAGVTWVADREWHLRLDYAYEDRQDIHIRQSVALGVGLRF